MSKEILNGSKLRIIPLGGLGEIGKNMMAYQYDGEIIVVDAGLMFPENDMLGIDYIIPDFQYLLENRNRVRGIIVTHGHEDHTGAITHLIERLNVPLYSTALTRGLLEVKLSRGGLLSKCQLNTVQSGDILQLGPFQIEFFHVCHSIPDGVGLGITTPAGLVIHTGDYKFDHTPVDNWPTDYAKLAEFAGRGVMALMADSTNADKPGWTPSERVVDSALDSVFHEARGRVIVASFASLISRMQQVANAAIKHRRKLTFVGSSMVENVKIARKLGYLELPDDLQVNIDQALKMNPKDVAVMTTGSQGEPTSILGRLSTGTNRQFDIMQGDTVVLSAHPIPGNEETVNRTINRLFRRGANVIYESIAPVHVSGHARQEEMKLLLHLVNPRYFIPIHGELRHLKQHAVLAQEVGIPAQNIAVIENGQVVELEHGELHMGERIPGGYVFVDGSGVGEIGPSVVREREVLARDGFVLVNLTMDRSTCHLMDEPEIITRGFVHTPEAEELFEAARQMVTQVVNCTSNGKLEADLTETLKSFFYTKTKRRPMVFVTLSRT